MSKIGVYFTLRAEKDLRKINFIGRKKIQKGIYRLEKDNNAGKKLQGDLQNRYSLKAWPYRIIYRLNKSNIEVLRVLHRQGAYK